MSDIRLRVDLDKLITALQNHGVEGEFYLDLQTGVVEMYYDGMFRNEEIDIDEVLDAEPDRYRFIEGISSGKGYRIMQEFIEDHAPVSAKQPLWKAIEGKKPFRQFKDTLIDLGDVRDQYFKYEVEVYTRLAREWLEDEEIDAVLVNGDIELES